MKRHLISILILTILLNSSFTKRHLTNSNKTTSIVDTIADQEFNQTWLEFSKAILSQDLELIKSLSSDCILCSDCFVNTPIEDSVFKEFQEKNPDKWYNKLYYELCYISIDKFLTEDLNLIFNEKVKSRLLDKTKIIYADNNHNSKAYSIKCIIGSSQTAQCEFKEVLLTYIDPTPKFEGSQWSFAFVKTNGKYKFCGFSTIP